MPTEDSAHQNYSSQQDPHAIKELFADTGMSQEELKEIERELHEKAEVFTFHQPPKLQTKQFDALTHNADKDTKEFVQLVEFIKGEHHKNQKINNSQLSEKSIKVQRYDDIKNLDFERNIVQKGLQINRAA